MSHNSSNRVVILIGADKKSARPDEREGFTQAEALASSLSRLGFRSEIISVTSNFDALREFLTNKPFFIINLVEEIEGHCRLAHLVPAMLEAYNLNFSGASALSYALTTNKIETKKILERAGLATPRWSYDGLDLSSEDPVIIKSLHEDASFGIDESSIVPARCAAQTIKIKSQTYGGQWFAETYIDGREFNVSLLCINNILRVLPIAEIIFVNYPEYRPKIIDYNAKWEMNSFGYKNTARNFLDMKSFLAEELSCLAKKAWYLLGLKDYARIDFRVDLEGRCYILEANANPSLAPDSGFIAACGQVGLELDQVIFSFLPKTERSLRNNNFIVNYFTEIKSSDIGELNNILTRSGFFTDEEICVATDILKEGLNLGSASSYNFIVAKSHSQVLGYACFGRIMGTKDRYDLYWLAIEPELRRQGLGRLLLQKVEEFIKEAFGRRVYIQTSGRKFYEPTRDFYAALGFEQVGQLKDYYGPCDDQIIFMKDF